MTTLTFEQYAVLARKTLKPLPHRQHMEHLGLGVLGEVGEFADAVKKHFIYGKPLDKVNLLEEGGDAFWYIINYLPELKLNTAPVEVAFVQGKGVGSHMALKMVPPTDLLLEVASQMSRACMDLLGDEPPSGAIRMTAIQILARGMGCLYGFFDLDIGESLYRNIEKLRLRYGDKFTEGAALNRNLEAEREALEGRSGVGVNIGDGSVK